MVYDGRRPSKLTSSGILYSKAPKATPKLAMGIHDQNKTDWQASCARKVLIPIQVSALYFDADKNSTHAYIG